MANNLLWLPVALLLLAAAAALLWRLSFQRTRRRLGELRRAVESLGAGQFRPPAVAHLRGEWAAVAGSLADAAAQLAADSTRLSDERDFSAAVLASMTEGVAVVDDRERILFANGAFAEAVGAVEECRGRTLLEVVRHSSLIEAVQGALMRAEMVRAEVEFGTVRPRTFALTAAPVAPPEASAARGAVLVLHDVTEIRRLERVRRDFVANVSHELRTPLTTIQGFAETLLGGALDDPKSRGKFLEIIRDHAARLGRITDDLLKLSAIEGGSMTFRVEPVSLPQLIEHCMEAVSLKAKAHGLEIASDTPQPLPLVRGDSLRLEEVLKNLLENAIQYTPSPGRIRVSAALEGDYAVLCVEDTGIGIPSTDQQRIFERFYRVDVARSREAGGTGLGLAIAKHIVEAHQGRLWVESELGKGSRFFVALPVWPAEVVPASPAPAPEAGEAILSKTMRNDGPAPTGTAPRTDPVSTTRPPTA
ncbi:MAG TPA: ATP-binding protein [Candidatus Acidoferrales bacterium]|nr:ATP-binding protein [Candidatus Acidoferrales bacterium]